MSQLTTRQRRERRHKRVRKDVFGTAERPRLVVFRSNRASPPSSSTTPRARLAAASWLDKKNAKGAKTDQAAEVGKLLAANAKKAGIERDLRPGRLPVPRACEGARRRSPRRGLEF